MAGSFSDAKILELASTNTTPIKIEDIYQNTYVALREAALAKGDLEWTMFAMLIKGKDVNQAVKNAAKSGITCSQVLKTPPITG